MLDVPPCKGVQRIARFAVARTDADEATIIEESELLNPLGVTRLDLAVRHIGVNRTYVDRARSVVVRVHHDDISRADVDKSLRHARRLAESGTPVVTPLADRCVELPRSSCWATYWPCLDDANAVKPKTFGRFVARWHMMALTSGIQGELPPFDEQARARTVQQCAQALRDGVPAEITETLVSTLESAFAAIGDHDAQFVLHGDMHKRNAVVTEGGKILAIDLDTLCVGRIEHDLAPTVMAIQRYHSPSWDARVLIRGYRSLEAPFSKEALLHAVKVREVLTSLHGLTLWDDPGGRSELLQRIRTMAEAPSSDVQWQPFIRVTPR